MLFGDKKAAELGSREKILQRQTLWYSSIPRKRLHEFFVNMTGKNVKRAMMVLDQAPATPSAQPPQQVDSATGKRGAKNSRKAKKADEWGQVIISASSEGEQSWEPDPQADPGTVNSYFTNYFLENIKHSGGYIQDSFSASVPNALEKVMQVAQKSQRPQSLALPNQEKWNFPLNLK